MADLAINLAGIRSPNPFWVASGPPSNTAYQAHRAFEAGWGGLVWKTIGDPIVNVSSRYGAWHAGGARLQFNREVLDRLTMDGKMIREGLITG